MRFRGHYALFSRFRALFMGFISTLFRKNIKNGSHGTIHTFKNYFITMFLVFSFQQNKLYPNRPLFLVWNMEKHRQKRLDLDT